MLKLSYLSSTCKLFTHIIFNAHAYTNYLFSMKFNDYFSYMKCFTGWIFSCDVLRGLICVFISIIFIFCWFGLVSP